MVAAVTLAGLALPAALLASTGTAAAATNQPANAEAPVAVTGMSPQSATARSELTVSGVLTNTSKTPVSGWVVQLDASATPVTSDTLIGPGTIPIDDFVNIQPIGGARWRSGQLQPGQSVRWQIRFRARKIGMTQFGVYPLAAVARSRAGTVLGATTTYLPYMPGKKSPYASTRPRREQISWLWPLIDKPMLGPRWQNVCKGSAAQATALAASMRPGGRLANLVAVGQRGTAAAAARQAEAMAGRSVQSKAASGAPSQSLAGLGGITWAIDPALLADAKALTTCRSSAPGLAQAATAWLTAVSAATAGQPMFAMPYGDPNVVALIRQNHQGDVQNAFALGRALAGRILHRNLVPSGSQQADIASEAEGTAWPAGGAAGGFSTIQNLAAYQIRVSTLVLNRSALPQAQGTVVQTQNGSGGYTKLLLANDNLASLLGSAGSARGSTFGTSQAFLAETALLAARQPGQPIVVAPPARWSPAGALAASVLAGTASAPWLNPVSLTRLASRKSAPQVFLPQGSPGEPSYPRKELRQLKQVGQQIHQLVSIQAVPNPSLYLAIAAVESSAWDGASRGTAQTMLTSLQHTLRNEQNRVQIVAGKAGIRYTLGGLRGSVPVSIQNRLDFAIKVKLRLSYSQATGVKIVADPQVVTISADSPLTIKLHVQAAQVGSTTVTMRLESQNGQLLPASAARMTVQATQVGVLGMIIFACALGVFLLASAARAVRRGRPSPAASATPSAGGEPDGMGGDHGGTKVPAGGTAPSEVIDGDEMAGEPATVVSEHSELGAAGPPGL